MKPAPPETESRSRRGREGGLRLFLLGLFFAVGLLGFEGSSRLFRHFPAIGRGEGGDRGLWVYDATKGWFHAPHSVGSTNLGGPDSGQVRINSLGLRGGEISAAKGEADRRILVFGDSFAFGVGVDEPHLFTTRLQELLSRSDGGHRYEVVNLGVSGYSTDQELILLEELGPRLVPDLVVLVACDNDFEGNTQDFIYQRYYKPYFVLQEGRLSPRNVPSPTLSRFQRAKLWLGENSNAWNFLRSRSASSGALQGLLDLFQVAVPRSPAEPALPLMAALVSRFRASAEAMGASFLTLNTGQRGEQTQLFQALRPHLRREGTAFLGLEGNLAEARLRDPAGRWDFPHDPHWNVDSHRLAAGIVFAYLSQKGPWAKAGEKGRN